MTGSGIIRGLSLTGLCILLTGTIAAQTTPVSSEIRSQRSGVESQEAREFGLMWEYMTPEKTGSSEISHQLPAPQAVDTVEEKPSEIPIVEPTQTKDSAVVPAKDQKKKKKGGVKPGAVAGQKKEKKRGGQGTAENTITAAPLTGPKPLYVKLDFSNVPLIDLVYSYSQITGENFVYADAIEGNANIVTKNKMTLEEARDLLEIALGMSGYTVLWGAPRGVKFNKIIKKENALNDGDVPVVGEPVEEESGEDEITIEEEGKKLPPPSRSR